MARTLNPAIGQLRVLIWINPGSPFAAQVNKTFEPVSATVGDYPSNDNWAVNSFSFTEDYVGGYPSGSVNDIWFISTWAPISVKITYEIVVFSFTFGELSRTPVTVFMNAIDIW